MQSKIEIESIFPGQGVSKGLVQAGLSLRARRDVKLGAMKDLLNRVGAETKFKMFEQAPDGPNDDPHPKLRDSISYDPAKYFPGGAGGGGEYRAFVGIKLEDEVPHQRYVVEDTAPYDSPNFMVFASQSNEMVFTKHREGYAAITGWYKEPFAEARIAIQQGVRELPDTAGSVGGFIPG
jgi:hypothetical protein